MQDKNTKKDIEDVKRTAEIGKRIEEKNEETEVILNTENANEHEWHVYVYTLTEEDLDKEIEGDNGTNIQNKNEETEVWSPGMDSENEPERKVITYASTPTRIHPHPSMWHLGD